jgi:hypothetical protein
MLNGAKTNACRDSDGKFPDKAEEEKDAAREAGSIVGFSDRMVQIYKTTSLPTKVAPAHSNSQV